MKENIIMAYQHKTNTEKPEVKETLAKKKPAPKKPAKKAE